MELSHNATSTERVKGRDYSLIHGRKKSQERFLPKPHIGRGKGESALKVDVARNVLNDKKN